MDKTKTVPRPDQCMYCRFVYLTGPEFAVCRRRAPVVSGNGSAWPTVWHDSWCGEFEVQEIFRGTTHFPAWVDDADEVGSS